MGHLPEMHNPTLPEPFPRRTGPFTGFHPAPESVDAPIPPLGVERRVIRRAEALWKTLRGTNLLPPAAAARELLTPPYARCAMLMIGRYTMYVGNGLKELGVELSPHRPPQGSFPARLEKLAATSIRMGIPMVFDTNFHPQEKQLRNLLARAIALPFAPSKTTLSSVVVVASWRIILSDEATNAIHEELSSAGKANGKGGEKTSARAGPIAEQE